MSETFKMKKTLLFIIAAAALSFCGISKANAQEIFHKGNSDVSLLVGFGGTYFVSGQSMQIPALQAVYEYCVVDNLINGNNGSIGVGVGGGFLRYGNKYVANGIIGSSYTNVGFVAVRGSFHYQFAPKLDTYAGLHLGCDIFSQGAKVTGTGVDASKTSSSQSDFGWFVFVGGRYYFTPAFAINLELGYGITIANLGVTFRF